MGGIPSAPSTHSPQVRAGQTERRVVRRTQAKHRFTESVPRASGSPRFPGVPFNAPVNVPSHDSAAVQEEDLSSHGDSNRASKTSLRLMLAQYSKESRLTSRKYSGVTFPWRSMAPRMSAPMRSLTESLRRNRSCLPPLMNTASTAGALDSGTEMVPRPRLAPARPDD